MKDTTIDSTLAKRPTIYVVNWTEVDDYGSLQEQRAFSDKDVAFDFMVSLPNTSYASINALKLWDVNPDTLIEKQIINS